MRIIAFAAAVGIHLFLTSSVNALVVADDPGGLIVEYIMRWESVANSGEAVTIDGECTSACTLILGIVSKDKICVTPNATFGFHRASLIWKRDGHWHSRPSTLGTMILLRIYPDWVRYWIHQHGGLTTKVKYMPGTESGLQACQ